jgi:hypothetical protein
MTDHIQNLAILAASCFEIDDFDVKDAVRSARDIYIEILVREKLEPVVEEARKQTTEYWKSKHRAGSVSP